MGLEFFFKTFTVFSTLFLDKILLPEDVIIFTLPKCTNNIHSMCAKEKKGGGVLINLFIY